MDVGRRSYERPSNVQPQLPSRFSTLNTEEDEQASNAPLASSSTLPRPPRLRSRTSTFSRAYSPGPNGLPTVMSRETSLDETEADVATAATATAGPSTYVQVTPPSPSKAARKSSKSVSYTRPTISINSPITTQRSLSQYPSTAPQQQSLLPSPNVSPLSNVLKRRISTPSIYTTLGPDDARSEVEQEEVTSSKKAASRARSTSTSFVLPQGLAEASPTIATPGLRTYESDRSDTAKFSTPPTWGLYVTPASPEDDGASTARSRGVLAAAYDLGEAYISRLVRLVRQGESSLRSRQSEDSEKGVETSEDDGSLDTTTSAATRLSEERVPRGKYSWGLFGSTSDDDAPDGEYFSLPPTPPPDGEAKRTNLGDFQTALLASGKTASLPTPALSSASLSNGTGCGRKRLRRIRNRDGQAYGWWKTVYDGWARYTPGKTGEAVRELGWTVGTLVGLFFVTLIVVIWLISGMPITTLKHIPSSTTDLQLLSAEIRGYMASSDVGWWHTVGVLTFVGCWKHAWSVPGAVVLNILVGSLLEPMPALGLLTIITATGSLGSYCLSRPLAPLIAVLFPKPLSLVRAALAPESIPSPTTLKTEGDLVTPIQLSSDPSDPPLGGPQAKADVWRRLLIMRAMGFVPWSGMNVACGVVGVDWKTFWLTTAAGSASWSYVTASVGNILARLAVPPTSAALAMDGSEEMLGGESLTSLLRDPVLIAKLVFLSLLTLVPVLLKRRSPSSAGTSRTSSRGSSVLSSVSMSMEMSTRSSLDEALPAPLSNPTIDALRGPPSPPLSPLSPLSPLAQSLARFTPVPAAFDLLSFGRTAARTGGRAVLGGVRTAALGAAGLVNGVVGR